MKAPMTMALLFACLSLQVFSQTEKVSNRGLYVDHGLEFVTRSNASTKQLELLNYCQANHVTYIMMDGMAGSTSDDVFNTTGSGPLLNESNAHKLSAFINLSKRYGIEEVGVGLESEEGVESAETYDFDHLIKLDQLINGVIKYNSISRYSGKINLLEVHLEFWAQATPALRDQAYAGYLSLLQKAYDAKLKYPENYLRIDTYVADYDNDNINDDQQAQSISSLADRVYILKYTNSPNQVFSAGVIQRLKNFGKNTAKKIELWSFLSSEPLYCGEILDNNSNYNTLDKLEKKWDDDYTTSYNAGDYTGGNNFRIGGHMWYSYQDAVSYTANQPTSCVSLGRHIKKSGNDCPVILTAQAVGTAPFNFKWNKEGSTTILRNVSNPISGVDTYRPTGVGKFFVTVTDATGKKSIDYIIIYSDFAVLYPCNPLGEGSLTSKGESGVETPGDFEAEHSELDGIAVITIGDQVYLKNTTDVFVDFSVFDNLGRKLPGVSGRIEGKGEFPVNLASGVYNVRCQKSNGEYFFKRFAQ